MRNTLRVFGVAILPPLAVLAGVWLAWMAWQKVPKRVPSLPSQPPLDQVAAMPKSIEMREAIIRQVLDKEISLWQAAAWFYHLNDERDGGPREAVHRQFTGRDDKERACRQVIFWAETRVYEHMRSHEEVDAVVRALEKELEEHTARHGKVVLPEGP